MNKLFFKKLCIAFSSLALGVAFYAIICACAGGDWDESENTNITPEVFIGKVYSPFFFTEFAYYYDIGHDTEHDRRFNLTNVEEWQGYLGKGFPSELLDYFLNKSSQEDIKKVVDFYSGKNLILPDSLSRYQSAITKKNTKQEEFFRYLILAKQCEAFATNRSIDYWDYEDKEQVSPDAALGPKLQKGMQKASSDFLKQRYWFQLIRYHFFDNDYDGAIALFEQYKPAFPQNEMYFRSMGYCAGAYYKKAEYSQANYYYSLIFAGSDKQKVVAHWSFHPQDESDWEETLELCKNNKEKITLWQMLGIFYGDEMRSMKEIYKLNPSSDALDLLLVRRINILENALAYKQDQSPADDENATVEKDFLWCEKVIDEGKISNPFLWNIVTGYLGFLNGNNDASLKYYVQAEKVIPKTQLAEQQLHLLRTLTHVGSLTSISAKDEQNLLPDLQWLFSFQDSKLRTSRANRWIHQRLASIYESQSDYAKAECFNHNVNMFADRDKLLQYKAFLSRQNPTDYEKLCYAETTIKLDDVWEYEAILSAYSDNLEQAVYQMEQLAYETQLLSNPFNGKIQDCHDCDHAAPQKVKYTKLSFLQKMKEMENAINDKNDIYNNALLLGNAFYNMSHYGNARIFYSCEVITDAYSPFALDSIFRPMLTDNTKAKKYYQMALQNATNDEQRAKCTYMLAKCERNEWYNDNYFNDSSNEYRYYDDNTSSPDFIEWEAFKTLKQRYSNTKYYQDVIKECGYFRKVAER